MKPNRVGYEKVTPAMAKKWLESHNDGNRPLSQMYVDQVARDMANGHYMPTDQPIVFDKNGRLIDGQHRLSAIVMSGKTVEFLVIREAEPKTALFYDQGRKRSMADAGKFFAGEELTRKVEATAKAMFDPMLSCRHTRMELWDLYLAHRKAIEFAVALFHGFPKQFQRAQLVAVVARAYYTQDHDRLRQFAKAVKDGMITSPGDRGAIMIRDELQTSDFTGNTERRAFYRRAEYRLSMYLRRNSRVSKHAVADTEMFPIPGEKGYTAPLAKSA